MKYVLMFVETEQFAADLAAMGEAERDARQFRHQAQHQRPRPAPRLNPAETRPDPAHQIIGHPPPGARVYAVASRHRKIIMCRHNRPDGWRRIIAPSSPRLPLPGSAPRRRCRPR